MNLTQELAALERLTARDLRERYAEVFGEATHANSKPWLLKRLAWRLQANAEGGLSERALARANELANVADLRTTAPKTKPVVTALPKQSPTPDWPFPSDSRLPIPGTVITRQYKGRTLQVVVLGQGFEFEGEVFKSLSAVAKRITGSHYNGYHFFKLTQPGGAT